MAATSPSGRDRLTLHVLQLGAIAVVLAALPYKAFDLDRYFVPKELVLHSCAAIAALVCIRNRNRITVTAVDVILAAFLVSSAVSMLFAINLWAAERAFAISLSGAALFWVAASLRRVGLVRPLLVVLAVGVVIGAATSLAQAFRQNISASIGLQEERSATATSSRISPRLGRRWSYSLR